LGHATKLNGQRKTKKNSFGPSKGLTPHHVDIGKNSYVMSDLLKKLFSNNLMKSAAVRTRPKSAAVRARLYSM